MGYQSRTDPIVTPIGSTMAIEREKSDVNAKTSIKNRKKERREKNVEKSVKIHN